MSVHAKNRDLALRRLAANRGLRLVKSKRRNPDAADYGRYGLLDPDTKEKVFGFARTRVKASPEEIEEYLRNDVRDSWKRSLRKV
ncbi:MAG: hypothetical protein H0W74_03650 [Sphingosinicella sp.]|nr:hypothetical protein [Sphingosinicella sp.]